MGKIRKMTMTAALAITALYGASGCLDSRPKVLGGQKKFDFSAFDTGTAALFKFNFAFKGAASGSNTIVYMQGAANSKSAMIGTCNFAGTGCACRFLKSDGSLAGPDATGAANLTYDSNGNYYRCLYSGNIALVDKVKMVNIAETTMSEPVTLETSTSLTLAKLIGTDLDINRVRYIFRYACEFNFLQKEGTTTQGFDCSNAQVSCDPNQDINNNFCILKSRFPYFLFSDTYSTNFFQKISDKIYNGGGTDKICGLQIKQIDCVGPSTDAYGTPQKKFGLYAEQSGIWDTAVQLGAGPDLIPVSYGFAAKTSSTNNECPPGLEKRIFYKVTIKTDDLTPSHNYTSALVATEIDTPTTTPTAFGIDKYGGGHCDPNQTPSQCTFPGSYAGIAKAAQTYSSTGQTEFCVIPHGMLP